MDIRGDDNPRRDHFPLYFNLSSSPILHHMLYDPGDKRGVWCKRNYRRLPDLSADRLQMGSHYGRRLVWESEGARFGHRHLESFTRRYGCGASYAGTMGITTCKGKEGGLDLHVRDRHHVWHPKRPAPVNF